jgi:hypothetical protein
MSSPSTSASNNNNGVHPIVQYGCTAGFCGVVGTVVAGVVGTLAKRKSLYSSMLKTRIVLVGSTLALYVSGTGFIPVPPPIVAVFGPPTRPPPMH